MKKAYTVTGATGYIGSKVVEHLTKNGHFVYAIVRESSKLTPLLKDNENVSLLIYDGNEEILEYAIKNSDYVIHLGALYTTAQDEKSTKDLISSNILFSTQLFNAANNVKKDVVITTASTFSSLDVEGNYSPSTLYAATKSAVETIAQYYKDLSIHFLTFPDTYGPGDWRNKIHNLVLKNESWPFQFRSHSEQKIRMLHIDDVIGHLLSSLEDREKGTHFHDIYETGTLLTLKDLSEILTDKECLFNESAEIVEIPMNARDFSKDTGYKVKHTKVKFN